MPKRQAEEFVCMQASLLLVLVLGLIFSCYVLPFWLASRRLWELVAQCCSGHAIPVQSQDDLSLHGAESKDHASDMV